MKVYESPKREEPIEAFNINWLVIHFHLLKSYTLREPSMGEGSA